MGDHQHDRKVVNINTRGKGNNLMEHYYIDNWCINCYKPKLEIETNELNCVSTDEERGHILIDHMKHIKERQLWIDIVKSELEDFDSDAKQAVLEANTILQGYFKMFGH